MNTNADANNPLSVSASGSLFTHDGDSHRLTINKNSTPDTASVVFQNNWSGRAEFGLTESNEFELKVSPDGQNWQTALSIDETSGNVGIGAEPTNRLRVSGGMVQFGWNFISALEASGGAAMEVMAGGTGDRHAYFDFHACDEHADYASRFIRWGGVNGPFSIYNRESGGITFNCENPAPVQFTSNGNATMNIAADGHIGIAIAAPTCLLHVGGQMRLEPVVLAALPAAASAGAGAIAYVTDKPGGAGLMVCNGSAWT